MKKFITFTAIFCLLFCVITGCVTTKKTEEESGSTTKISTTKESISSTESTSELLTGLEVSVYKIIDNSNVIIQFNKDFWGYTDVPNYEIKDKSGKVQEIISITSAFAELGGQIPRVFHIVFKSPLSPGEYTITVSNITDSLTPPLHKFAPASTTLIIPESSNVDEIFSINNKFTELDGTVTSEYNFKVGVGKVDITPKEAVILAGSPFPEQSSTVDVPLYVKAMIIESDGQKVAIITLDTLKYPVDLYETAVKDIGKETGIPANNIIICASHTHSGPLYFYYKDGLVGSIVEAVKSALNNREPCKLGVSRSDVTGISHNRRLLIEGECWNDWMVMSPTARYTFPAAGPIDTDLIMLTAIKKDGKYKAILWNYACHAAANSANTISADYPGHVQEYVKQQLGYDVLTFFIAGACGDINPNNTPGIVGEEIGKKILDSIGSSEFISSSKLYIKRKEVQLPRRENPVFPEDEISTKWPKTLESYKYSFQSTLLASLPYYKAFMSSIRIGEDFAIVTNPNELFASLGINIKENSPFRYTIVAELTNGCLGYVPTEKDFEVNGYETWFGEHSFLSTKAGNIIVNESIGMLKDLQTK